MRSRLSAPEDSGAADAGRNVVPSHKTGLGLSSRLLLLTIGFVLLAEILIFVPSIANFRNTWLSDKLAQARAAALILEKTPPESLPKSLVDELLAGMETTMIALRIENSRRLLAISDTPPMVDYEVDLRAPAPFMDIGQAFSTLIGGGERTIRVVGPAPRGGDFVEIIINERPLRAAMLVYSRNIGIISLIISLLTAGLVFGALNRLIVRPVKRLAEAVSRFRDAPDDVRNLLPAPARSDEIGSLERNVAQMQQSLQRHLRQREHLANLGLAVAKINHDLRNMLASAQLMADRLSILPDPDVQRFMPKLMNALDRAITFCQSSLAYGRAEERLPLLRALAVSTLIDEVSEQLQLGSETTPAARNALPSELVVLADSEHLARVFTNLLRNATAALEPMGPEGMIEISGCVRGDKVEIDLRDNGPGIPPKLRERLFMAFAGSSRPGGTGLGLAIADELMRAMGGRIELLADEGQGGTTFRLTLPIAGPESAPASL